MNKAQERTKVAAQFLASHIIEATEVYESGNGPEGWIFNFIYEGESYNVEVAANVIHDDEEGDLHD